MPGRRETLPCEKLHKEGTAGRRPPSNGSESPRHLAEGLGGNDLRPVRLPGTRHREESSGLGDREPEFGMIPHDLPELLSPPLEEGAGQRPEPTLLPGREGGRVEGPDPDHGRVHLRPRPEGPGRDPKDGLHDRHAPNAHRQCPVRPRARSRQDAVGDLPLERQEDLSRTGRLEEAEEDRGGQVVGDVPDDPEAAGPGEGMEIDAEYVLMDHLDQRISPEAAFKVGGQIVIDLDEEETRPPPCGANLASEPPGERPSPGTDLEDDIPRRDAGFFDDPCRRARVHEEALAERALRRPHVPGSDPEHKCGPVIRGDTALPL